MVAIETVQVLEQFTVRLLFNSGITKIVNLEPLLRGPIFHPLLVDRELFLTVRVDAELGTIVWSNGADMDPNVLYGTYPPAREDIPQTEQKPVAK